mmetsp:Transcript_93413/g.302424  ORF Transcript_93413/g.302424 Transcript_93413/m.302424 type:complete len:320 (+) Transcript_93413:1109-2068(+)
MNGLLGAIPHIACGDVVGPVLPSVDAQHLDVEANATLAMLTGHRVDVPHDLAPRGVVLVGPKAIAWPIDDPVTNLRRVHAGIVVAVKVPDSSDLVVLVEADHRFASLRQGIRLVDPGNACADHHGVDRVRQRRVGVTDVCKGTIFFPTVVLFEEFRKRRQHLRIGAHDVPGPLQVVIQALGLAQPDELELPGRRELLPRLHGLPRREAITLVVQRRDRHRHSCPALVPEDVRAHRRHVRGRAAPAPVGDVAAREDGGPIGEAPRPVDTGKVVRSRAICHHQGSWDVRRLHTNLDPLQNLVGDQRTNALSEPHRVDAVGE